MSKKQNYGTNLKPAKSFRQKHVVQNQVMNFSIQSMFLVNKSQKIKQIKFKKVKL